MSSFLLPPHHHHHKKKKAISILPFTLGYFVVPKDKLDPARDKRIDYPGAGLIVSSLVLLIFSLSQGQVAQPNGWSTPCMSCLHSYTLLFTNSFTQIIPFLILLSFFLSDIIATLVLSILLLITFIIWEHFLTQSNRFTTPPLLPLEIFTRGKLSLVIITGFFAWCSFQPFLYHATLYFQQYLGLSPMKTMIRFLPTVSFFFFWNFRIQLFRLHPLNLGIEIGS